MPGRGMPKYTDYVGGNISLSDVINWAALDAYGVIFRNWLATLDATECPIPLLVTLLVAAMALGFVMQPRRTAHVRSNAKSNGKSTKNVESTKVKSGEPRRRLPMFVLGVAVVVCAVGAVHEIVTVSSTAASKQATICNSLADAGKTVAYQRCVNETSEYLSLKRNWEPLDVNRNYSLPRPSLDEILPEVACIRPLTLQPFNQTALLDCVRYLRRGGVLPQGGLINAKVMVNQDFDVPYSTVALETLRRTRLQVCP